MKGTPEGRRLFAGCVAGGLSLGAVAAVGAVIAFHDDAEILPCQAEDGPDFAICRELDVAGFALRSSWAAAWTVGAIGALLGWVFCVVWVLYSTSHHHHQDEPGGR
jgi:hypothetical protein